METYFHSLVRGERKGLGPFLQRAGLRILSWPYGWVVWGRNRLFDRGWLKTHSAKVPVVSVGNLTVGGTGKTPCVEYLARFYREHDWRVAILSRGYGSLSSQESGFTGNDEALVLEENLPDVPHLQGADRVVLARTAVEELESEILVLDDGFQHRRLHRELDIVLIDATLPWGHGYLLPRGLLREPVAGLRRAQVVMITRCDQVPTAVLEEIKKRVLHWAPRTVLVETTHRPGQWLNASRATRPLESLHGRPWAAFCGIGNPEAFRRTLTRMGGQPAAWRTFPDHHAYTRSDVEDLRNWAGQLPTEGVVVTTQKDLVKLRLDRLGDHELWALHIQLEVQTGEEALREKLFSIVRRQ